MLCFWFICIMFAFQLFFLPASTLSSQPWIHTKPEAQRVISECAQELERPSQPHAERLSKLYKVYRLAVRAIGSKYAGFDSYSWVLKILAYLSWKHPSDISSAYLVWCSDGIGLFDLRLCLRLCVKVYDLGIWNCHWKYTAICSGLQLLVAQFTCPRANTNELLCSVWRYLKPQLQTSAHCLSEVRLWAFENASSAQVHANSSASLRHTDWTLP